MKKKYKFITNSVSFGQQFYFTQKGDVFTFGFNSDQQLALGGKGEVSIPTKISCFSKIVKEKFEKIVFVSCERHTSTFISNVGRVYGIGRNIEGQHSLGHCNHLPILTYIKRFKNYKMIFSAGGAIHTAYISACGKAFAAGYNNSNQIGVLFPDECNIAVRLECDAVEEAICGWDYSIFLSKDRMKLYKFGLINGERKKYERIISRKNDGIVMTMSNIGKRKMKYCTPVVIKFNERIVRMRGAEYFVLVLCESGKLFGTLHDVTRLGNEKSESLYAKGEFYPILNHLLEFHNVKVIDIGCGMSFGMFLTKTKKVYGFGNVFNNYISESQKKNINVLYFSDRINTPIPIKENIQQIECGGSSFFLINENSIWAGGANNYGQFGNGNTQNYSENGKLIKSISLSSALKNKEMAFHVDYVDNIIFHHFPRLKNHLNSNSKFINILITFHV